MDIDFTEDCCPVCGKTLPSWENVGCDQCFAVMVHLDCSSRVYNHLGISSVICKVCIREEM